jgi:membrane protein YqaA with SNARE-associated domain
MTPAQVAWVSLLISFTSGFLPFVNVEAFLAGAAALSPDATLLLVVVPATVGQTAAKSLVYLGGRGLLRLPSALAASASAFASRLAGVPARSAGLVFSSALVGLPPFYVVSVAAGAARVSPGLFLGMGSLGRFLRFAAVFTGLRLMGILS